MRHTYKEVCLDYGKTIYRVKSKYEKILRFFNVRVVSFWSSNIFLPKDKKRPNKYKKATYRKRLLFMNSEESYRYYNNIHISDYHKSVQKQIELIGYPLPKSSNIKIKKSKIIIKNNSLFH